MGETFHLDIVENDILTAYSIDEPFGYDVISYKLSQAENKFARDNTIASEMVDLEFRDTRDHQLEKILYLNDKYGFESVAFLRVQSGAQSISMEFDFKDAETDGLTYFKCRLLQKSSLQTIKRRREIKVNLLSNKDLDGNPITPLVPENILLKAKPIVQISKWEAQPNATVFSSGFAGVPCFFNKIKDLTESEIEDSLTWFEDYTVPEGTGTVYPFPVENFNVVRAENNYKDITAVLELDLLTEYFPVDTPGNAQVQGYLVKGPGDFVTNFNNPANRFNFYNTLALGPTSNVYSYSYSGIVTINMGSINRGDFIWFVFRHGGSNRAQILKTVFNSASLTLTASSLSYNTITPSLRLVDVMRYVIKSISGLDINAPRFEAGGYLYDQRLFNGNFLRQKTNEPFYVTLKQLEEGLIEFNGDHEIQTDNKVFFGLYDDFYRDEEIAFFGQAQFDGFKKTYNNRYTLNRFSFGYKSYQSLKENSTQNTVDSVHGESEWMFTNKSVENNHEVKVEWIRDSFLIESTRRKAIEEAQSTATQDDDKLFVLDIYPTLPNKMVFSETSFLQHNIIESTLSLKNDGSFSWTLLGITTGQTFVITAGQNLGTYTVVNINQRTISLLGTPPTFEGEVNTGYTYNINASLLEGVNWTNQGITTSNIANGDNFANVRFSKKLNIENYHSKFLATANYYRSASDINNTFYKNNPDAVITYAGRTLREGDPILPINPILTPVLYEDCIFIMEFADFIALQNDIRTRRGFIRFIDNEGFVRKMFVWEMEYSPFEERLTITKGEEKHEPVIINIITNPDGTKTINNEYTVWEVTYEFTGEKLRIMDNRGELLYNPLFWHRIAVNGSIPTSAQELSEWMMLL